MLKQVYEQISLPIDLGSSPTIGNKPSDIEIRKTLKTKTILLENRYPVISGLTARPDFVCHTLADAAELVFVKHSLLARRPSGKQLLCSGVPIRFLISTATNPTHSQSTKSLRHVTIHGAPP
jgi:Histidinol phosphatase and related phosphatases